MPKPDWNAHYCAGKGSHRRPEDEERYRRNYDRIFRKPEPSCSRCRHFSHAADWCLYFRTTPENADPKNPPCGGRWFEEYEDERSEDQSR